MTQEAPASPPCEVIILTALSVEYQAVAMHLREVREIVHKQGTIYHQGNFVSGHATWQIAVAEIGMHGSAAAVETERAIAFFHPDIAFFIGVAGGLKDVQMGDVVVATKVYGYEAGKSGELFEPRPELWRADHMLEQRARTEANEGNWLNRLQTPFSDLTPRVFVAPIVAGEKVAASLHSPLLDFLRTTYGDALAVEMESHGFLQAVHANKGVRGLVIRGISDLIEQKAEADASGSQARAARHAATFAFQILSKLKPTPESEQSSVQEVKSTQQEKVPTSLLPSTEAIWNIPFAHNPFFVGREQELEDLSTRLHQPASTTTGQIQCISGLGGVGKTQLAIEYAYQHRHEYDYILWTRARSIETLNASYTECATLFKLPECDAQEQEIMVKAVKTWFQTHQKWLLILDSADEPNVFVPFLPPTSNGYILLTTRASNLTELGMGIAHSLEVTPFTDEQSVRFLLQRANLPGPHTPFEKASLQEREVALQIAHELGNLPLALNQAGAYLAATRTSLTGYFSLYKRYRSDLLKEQRDGNYSASVATTWNLSFDEVEKRNPAAAELLRACAMMAFDVIPEEILTTGARFLGSELSAMATNAYRLGQAIEVLHSYSLVRRNSREKTLTIHRLVQIVLRDAMSEEERHLWAERVMLAVSATFPEADQRNWSRCERLLPQALAATELIERYQLSGAGAGHLLYQTALYLQNRPRYAPIEQPSPYILPGREQLKEVDMAHIPKNLTSLFSQRQGQHAQSEALHQRALHALEQLLGLEYGDIISGLDGLAEQYQEQGKYVQAESLYQQILFVLNQQHVGTEHPTPKYAASGHPDMAFPLDKLARLHYMQKQYGQAEPLYRKALHIWEQQLGPEHLLIAPLLNDLANLYYAQGQYTQAEPLYKRALLILAKHPSGFEPLFQPSMQTMRKNYISLLRDMERYEEADKWEEEI